MVSRIHTIRAPNPSPMTLQGTNSYLIDCGDGQAICIDPGPMIKRHIEALLAKAREHDLRIQAIAVTHGHPDHAPAAAPLARATNATIFAHAASEVPHDRSLDDNATLALGQIELRTVDAPGHTFESLIFYEPRERALFTGDVILGEGYVVVAPPGGAMRPYQRTLQRLQENFADAAIIYGGHGPAVRDPRTKIADYIAHRVAREAQLLVALQNAPQTIPELVRTIYADTPQALWPAAARQLLAHLIALEDEGRVRATLVPRSPDAAERAILNPSWRALVGDEQAEVAEAEFGARLQIDALRRYELAS